MAPNQPILVVEDSPEDWLIMQRAFSKGNMNNTLIRVENGDDALDYLYHRGKYSDHTRAPRPGIILLDLNLPGTDGREVLAEVKSDPNLRSIPVVVLTTSKDERDIEACYSQGASSYIPKPVDMKGFLTAITKLEDYWFEIAVLPRGAKIDG
jgi:CheY-like chemotaxis protein